MFGEAIRAISSVGSEHLVYTQRVGGSNPSSPTKSRNESFDFFISAKRRKFTFVSIAEIKKQNCAAVLLLVAGFPKMGSAELILTFCKLLLQDFQKRKFCNRFCCKISKSENLATDLKGSGKPKRKFRQNHINKKTAH